MPSTATIHRMVLPDHVCPYGVQALQLLNDAGYAVEDNQLTSRAEVEAFKDAHDLDTTPYILIDGEPIGGCDDLIDYLDQG